MFLNVTHINRFLSICFSILKRHEDALEQIQRRLLKYLSIKSDGIHPVRGKGYPCWLCGEFQISGRKDKIYS